MKKGGERRAARIHTCEMQHVKLTRISIPQNVLTKTGGKEGTSPTQTQKGDSINMRPSSLPAIAQCPSFESGQAKSFTLDGTIRHEALQSKWNHSQNEIDPKLVPFLDDDSIEAIEWAFDYIQMTAPMLDYPLEIEQTLEATSLSGMGINPGTLDYHCGDNVFDFKWRERDYSFQLAYYALALMDHRFASEATVHILFGETRRAVVYKITREEATDKIVDMLADRNSSGVKYRWNPYCAWCAKVIECPLIGAAVESTRRHPDFDLESFDFAKIRQNEREASKALKTARVVKKWAEEVEKVVKELPLAGIDLPDFDLRSRAGSASIESVSQAFYDAGLDQDTFADCCSVSLAKLAEAWRAIHGVSIDVSRKEMKAKLGDNLKPGPKVYYLTAKKKKGTQ